MTCYINAKMEFKVKKDANTCDVSLKTRISAFQQFGGGGGGGGGGALNAVADIEYS